MTASDWRIKNSTSTYIESKIEYSTIISNLIESNKKKQKWAKGLNKYKHMYIKVVTQEEDIDPNNFDSSNFDDLKK